MEISDAIENFQQYLLVEKGLSNQTILSYTQDLKQFFSYFTNKQTTDDLYGYDLEEFLQHELSSDDIEVTTAIRRL